MRLHLSHIRDACSRAVLLSCTLLIGLVAPGSPDSFAIWEQTSQEDFQTGSVPLGVDTFETPGSVTLLPLNDDFEAGFLNTDRWLVGTSGGGYATAEAGKVCLGNAVSGVHSVALCTMQAYLTGDFEVTVRYECVDWPRVDVTKSGFRIEFGGGKWTQLERDYDTGYGGDIYYWRYDACGGGKHGEVTGDMTGSFAWVRSAGWLAGSAGGHEWGGASVVEDGFPRLEAWNDAGDPNPEFEIRFDNFVVAVNGGILNPTYGLPPKKWTPE